MTTDGMCLEQNTPYSIMLAQKYQKGVGLQRLKKSDTRFRSPGTPALCGYRALVHPWPVRIRGSGSLLSPLSEPHTLRAHPLVKEPTSFWPMSTLNECGDRSRRVHGRC